MDKGYSGLRRTRKRAHSSKCPCCYSSDEEEENHAITKKEKIKESNHNNGKRTSTRTRKLASDEDDSSAIGIASSPADSVNENRNSKKPQKTVVSEKSKNKGVSRNSTISNQESAKNAGNIAQVSEQGKKQSGKAGKVGSKKNTRSGNKDEIERGISLVESEHGLKKLSSNELHSTSRKVKKKKKKNGNSELQTDAGDANKNELEFKDKSLKSKKSAKAKTSTSSKNIGVQKQSSKDIGSSGIVDKGTLSDDTKKPGTKNNNTGKYKQHMSRGKNSKSGVASSGLSWRLSEEKEHTIPLESNKHSNASSSIHVKRKIEAFDHLFSELKKCPGFSKITVSSAAETLLKLTADKLKSMLPSVSPKKSMDVDKLATDKLQPSSKAKTSSTVSERKRRRTDPEKSSSVSSAIKTSSCFSSPKKTVPARGEEAKLSQAAEALVSFRANPTILRQEKTEAEVRLGQSTDKDIVNASTQKKSDATQSCVVKSPLETVTTAETLTVPRVIDSVNAPLQSQVAAQPQSTLLMQGALNQAMRFPTSSEANIQQIATVQQSMVNLDQVTSQLNSTATVPTPVVPTVSTPRTASLATSGMSSIMMSPVGVQNIQALLCRPTQPSNLQTPVAAQTSVPPLSAGGNNQQLQPQQPLKGMENVVSCVGSRTATNLLWNIKPATAPVVYLTSPQTLSGVRARNLIPQSEGHVTLPFTAGMGKVQSVGIPKTSLSSTSSGVLNLGKVTFVNQAVPLSVATVTGQRPILPREQRLPSLLPSAPQTASQLPVTTVVGPIPHNIPPVPVGSIPVQFSSLGVNTSLSAQQTTNSNVVMQAPITEVTIAQATVTQAPLVQVACVTTTQPTTVTPVSAKQAVKKFVHERTKSAELKRSSSLNSLTSNECITSTAVPERPQSSTITPPPSQECQSMDQSEKEGISHQSMEFNLHQAASALLSISSQDVLDMNAAQLGVGEGEDSMDEHDDEVVFTSKGVFRVGDVDVDPKYNRIGREGYTCGKCGKIFTSLSYLARHIKRVCPDMSCRKWKCTMCDKAFRHPFGLQQHIYTHTGERPHKCSQCPKAFYSSNDLRRHSRIHSGERPYHCKHCDKSFATTISLKTHTYIHTGEKPHKCPHCPKTFATSSKLGRHIVTHSEQRPFACGHCPKSFNRSGDLRRHNMHVHECREKPFEFVECDTPPSTTNNLTEDMTKDLENVTGTGQMRRCSVCKEMFHSSSDLGLHMLSHDAPESPIQDRNV